MLHSQHAAAHQSADENLDLKATLKSDKRKSNRRIGLMCGGVMVALLMLVIGGDLIHSLVYEDTGSALVEGHVQPVTSRIPGIVSRVLVEENQSVKKDQIIAILETNDLLARLNQAKAALTLARQQASGAAVGVAQSTANYNVKQVEATNNTKSIQANIDGGELYQRQLQAALPAAQKQVVNAAASLKREQAEYKLLEPKVARAELYSEQLEPLITSIHRTQGELRQAQENVNAIESNLISAKQGIRQAREMLTLTDGQGSILQAARMQIASAQQHYKTAQAAVAQAESTVHETELQLTYTKLVAGADGIVGRRAVEIGQRVQPGQSVVVIIEPKRWINANFTGGQISRLEPGQPVGIQLESVPQKRFSGHVSSISPATGSHFSLNPPAAYADQTSTKTVQTVPVKIEFDHHSVQGFENRILPGTAASVSVRVK